MNRVIKSIMVSIVVLTIGGASIGCNNKVEKPSIVGKIEELNIYDKTINILVKDNGTNKYQYDIASVTITKDTSVYIADKKADMNDLEKGQTIEVTFIGAVRESYPVQADAKIVTIVE